MSPLKKSLERLSFSPDIDQAYLASLLKKANGAKGEIYWVKKPELRKLGIDVENLKPVAPNDPAADAKVMKKLTVLQWTKLADEKGRFAVVCSLYTGVLGRPHYLIWTARFWPCAARVTQNASCARMSPS